MLPGCQVAYCLVMPHSVAEHVLCLPCHYVVYAQTDVQGTYQGY
jgi:hypothetical protein